MFGWFKQHNSLRPPEIHTSCLQTLGAILALRQLQRGGVVFEQQLSLDMSKKIFVSKLQKNAAKIKSNAFCVIDLCKAWHLVEAILAHLPIQGWANFSTRSRMHLQSVVAKYPAAHRLNNYIFRQRSVTFKKFWQPWADVIWYADNTSSTNLSERQILGTSVLLLTHYLWQAPVMLYQWC